MTKTAQSLSLAIVPDSGTGDLLDISGQGRIEIAADGGHTLILDYKMD